MAYYILMMFCIALWSACVDLYKDLYLNLFIQRPIFQLIYTKTYISTYLYKDQYLNLFIQRSISPLIYTKTYISTYLHKDLYLNTFIQRPISPLIYIKTYISTYAKYFKPVIIWQITADMLNNREYLNRYEGLLKVSVRNDMTFLVKYIWFAVCGNFDSFMHLTISDALSAGV